MTAAFTVASQAQTVYSVNAVGYVNVTVPANGFAILSNPLNQPTNSLSAVFPDFPSTANIFLWRGTAFSSGIRKVGANWLPVGSATNLVNPGEGFFVQNTAATPLTLTFVGEVPQGDLSVQYPAGFSLLGSQVPQTGKVETDLKLPAKSNDKVYAFTNNAYLPTATKVGANWVAAGAPAGQAEPVIGVGHGFWLQSTAAGNWTRTFSVNSQ